MWFFDTVQRWQLEHSPSQSDLIQILYDLQTNTIVMGKRRIARTIDEDGSQSGGDGRIDFFDVIAQEQDRCRLTLGKHVNVFLWEVNIQTTLTCKTAAIFA